LLRPVFPGRLQPVPHWGRDDLRLPCHPGGGCRRKWRWWRRWRWGYLPPGAMAHIPSPAISATAAPSVPSDAARGGDASAKQGHANGRM